MESVYESLNSTEQEIANTLVPGKLKMGEAALGTEIAVLTPALLKDGAGIFSVPEPRTGHGTYALVEPGSLHLSHLQLTKPDTE